MKNLNKLLIALLLFLFAACGSDSISSPDDDSLKITGISLSPINITKGADVSITGKGFSVGDVMTFKASEEYSSTVSAADATSATFPLPESISTGSYALSVSRGSQSMAIGTVAVTVLSNTDLPDVEGMNIKGIVSCDGEGIAGVVVSDGVEVTTTDDQGRYYLSSEKARGYVFISVPANYEAVKKGQIPQFFKQVSSTTSAIEQCDFSLVQVDNENHVVLALADWHLAYRNNDLAQYQAIVPDINSTIATFEAEGKKVYGLTLGDLTWDLFWYSNSFSLANYVSYMNMLNCPVFNTIGNHDNDPYVTGDFNGESSYLVNLGPNYYSFNLGKVHYVVLDDIDWINTGGMQGTVGGRNHNDVVSEEQMAWLEKDLATITDKSTPIVVGIHIPLYKRPSLDAAGNRNTPVFNISNASALKAALADFSDVHFLSGHTHANYANMASDGFMEHTLGAICGTWWWTGKNGYSGNHLSSDGSPGGYGVFEMNGTDISWYYKSADTRRNDKEYQFRAYDLNEVHITAAAFAPNASEEDMASYAGEYATVNNNNEILLFVWGYDEEWTVEMTENSLPLPITRTFVKDPLHIISYEAFRLNAGATPTSTFVTNKSANFFKAQASSATSTIEIKVTDRFGRVYSESMERPKTFDLTIK
ncbi:MAG: calcineurin-like phosphoesterase C-terminal domain-containing protein [Mangrovibacterium sp.]